MGSQPQAKVMPHQNGASIASAAEGTSGIAPLARFGSLPRQPSILSLTLDNFNFLDPGRNVGSMNMNEFLKNLWNSEEVQAMTTAFTGIGSNGAEDSPTEGSGGPGSGTDGTGLSRQTSLASQGSLGLTVPREISRKTVEEVWKDIHKPYESNGAAGNGTLSATTQATLGEMTLEDFLFKAGVVKEGEATGLEPLVTSTFGSFNQFNTTSAPSDRDGPGATSPPTLSLAPATLSQRAMDPMAVDQYKVPDVGGTDWLRSVNAQQQYAHHQQQMQAAHAAEQYNNHRQRVANGAMVVSPMGANGYGGMAPGMPGLVQQGMMGVMSLQLAPTSPASPLSDGQHHGNGLSLSPAGTYTVDGAMRGRRKGDGPQERTVEKRQRRMIKNRESAARSRARKQAYTVELEAEVTQLKEENNKLKRQQLAWQLEEITDRRKKQMMSHQAIQKELRHEGAILRRTRTGPW